MITIDVFKLFLPIAFTMINSTRFNHASLTPAATPDDIKRVQAHSLEIAQQLAVKRMECPSEPLELSNAPTQLRVQTDVAEVEQVLAWFTPFKDSAISLKVWLRCRLALTEGFTNVVRHAHAGKSVSEPIDLDVQLLGDRIEIRIWDQGAPFDLDAKLQQMSQSANFEEGGRGLLLMKNLTCYLSYTRTADSRNCLLLVFNRTV